MTLDSPGSIPGTGNDTRMWCSLVARLPWEQEAAGSSPAIRIIMSLSPFALAASFVGRYSYWQDFLPFCRSMTEREEVS